MDTTTTSDIRSRAAERVVIRPLEAADRQGLADAFSRLSEQTRRRRFHGAIKHPSARELDRLTRIDHHDHEALAALAPRTGRIVGVARFIRLPDDPQAAEVAIEVDDAWQGRGIGRRLMTRLLARAHAEGVTRLLAYVAADNAPVHAWAARMGAITEAQDGEATLYRLPLAIGQDRRAA